MLCEEQRLRALGLLSCAKVTQDSQGAAESLTRPALSLDL